VLHEAVDASDHPEQRIAPTAAVAIVVRARLVARLPAVTLGSPGGVPSPRFGLRRIRSEDGEHYKGADQPAARG
jgi:hypothetical protein